MNIKIIALIFIMGSFLAGAFISVLDPTQVNWLWFVPVLLVGLAGLYVFRKTQHGEARSSELLSGNMQVLETSLENLLGNLERLSSDSTDLPVYQARFEIAGERYINRVWSASTDGYVDEVRTYLKRATEQFSEALNLFAKLQKQFQPTGSAA